MVAELGSSSLYAARFRECAARALLLPRRDPKRRTPLWQQRQRSAQLLAVAGRYEQFPITLEAMRECVQDVYDLPGLRELMSDVARPEGAGGRAGHARPIALRAQPAVRLRRDVPLRDRCAAGRASGRGAVAGLHAARRAAGLGGDPGTARPGGAGRDRGVAAAAGPGPARPRRRGRGGPAAFPRRPDHRGGRGPRGAARVAGRAGRGPPGDPGADRWRAALAGHRGRRPGARRARCRAAGRRAGNVHRAGARPAGRPGAALRPHARAVPGRRLRHPVRARRGGGGRRAGPAGRGGPAGARGAAPARARWMRRADRDRSRAWSTATPRCCAGCGGRRWPGCGPRSSRSSSAHWAGSCPAGRGCRRRPRAGGAAGCVGRRGRRTCWGWSSSWPGHRCRPARWSR